MLVRMKLRKLFLAIILLLAAFLRFYQVDQIPHGLYIDEVSIAYNAHTILHEGKDEYGMQMPLFFKAFGEYKMPVAIYLTSASMAIFGKTDFAVRFPSALLGTLLVFILYLFVKELFGRSGKKITPKSIEAIALLSSFFAAISPVTIQMSRGGFEANIALFFYLLGGWLFLRYLKNQKVLFLFSSLSSFIVTIYTYNSYRLIIPLTLGLCFWYLFKHMKQKNQKPFYSALGFVIIMLIPLVVFSFSGAGASRFVETSAFTQPYLNFWQKLGIYPMIYLQNYVSYFSLPFLFASGDGFGRHTILDMGNLFRWQLPFLIVGLFFMLKNRSTFYAKLLLFVLLIAPITAAFTRPSPHTLRSLLIILPLIILCAYGCVTLWQKQRKLLKAIVLGIGIFAIYETAFYFHMYYVHYPLRTAPDWGSEYHQLITEASRLQPQYDEIVIDNQFAGAPAYRNFYNSNLKFHLIDGGWRKPLAWEKKKVLYITQEHSQEDPALKKTLFHTRIKDIRYADRTKSIFAQFWEL